MWEKEKTSKPFSTGILVLVLLYLKYRRVEKISYQ